MENFRKLGLSEETISAIESKGFTTPTPIQEKTIPKLLEGKNDIIAKAQTGTGKTACFALPIIETLNPGSRSLQALVLAPTRELAIQVAKEMESLTGNKKFQFLTVYGGSSINDQLSKLRKGVDIVVGTPGRVIDLIKRGALKLDHLSYAVLDEADEMLNMGFLDDIKLILSKSNDNKKMLMFSATMPQNILRIAKKFMHDYEIVEAASKSLTIELTDQFYFDVKSSDRFNALRRIIAVNDDFYGIIFCKTKVEADHLVHKLLDEKYSAAALHGDISQAQREKILLQFRKKNVKILVATDVAARGIDVTDLTHVVNFSLPQSSETYVHRIGRTGRAGKRGTAITFLMPSERRKLSQIERITNVKIEKGTLPDVDAIMEIKKKNIAQKILTIMESENSSDYSVIAKQVLEGNDAELVVSSVLKYAFQNELDKNSYKKISKVESRGGRDFSDKFDGGRRRSRGGSDRNRGGSRRGGFSRGGDRGGSRSSASRSGSSRSFSRGGSSSSGSGRSSYGSDRSSSSRSYSSDKPSYSRSPTGGSSKPRRSNSDGSRSFSRDRR